MCVCVCVCVSEREREREREREDYYSGYILHNYVHRIWLRKKYILTVDHVHFVLRKNLATLIRVSGIKLYNNKMHRYHHDQLYLQSLSIGHKTKPRQPHLSSKTGKGQAIM